MYITSDQHRQIEEQARKMRAEMLRSFFATLFARSEQAVAPKMGKPA